MSNQHVLKIHPAPLADLLSGAKTAEVRRNDRGFQVGDTVRLMEVNPETLNWTGRPDLVRTISHIQTGYGLPEGLCVLSYAALATQPAAGESVATLMRRRSIGGPSVGVVRFDASRLPEGALVDVYIAPPAAAHGDDTRRIDWLACKWRLGGTLPDVDHGSFREAIDVAMRAQGEGGQV